MTSVIEIIPGFVIGEDEFEERFVQASGPGGQNVNKVATAVQLRFFPARSALLDDAARQRLAKLAGRKMSKDGVLTVTAQRFRTQEGNRRDARIRLVALILAASVAPAERRATKPPRASREKRIEGKKLRGRTKRLRGKPMTE
jgi:ribosome-associated protein